MDTTDIIAGYAAIVATGLLVWDVYKWLTSGPKIMFRVLSNMKIYNDPDYPHTYILAEATNKGSLPTTLTTIGLQHYKNRFYQLIKRSEDTFAVGNTGLGQSLPRKLEPGDVWKGLIQQDKKIEYMAKRGLLVCELYVSHKKKPKAARVTLKSKNNK